MAFVVGGSEQPRVEVMPETPVTPEVLATPEAVEAQPIEAAAPIEMPKAVETQPAPVVAAAPQAVTPVASDKSETRIKIEKILEEDLTEVYQNLPDKAKARFISEGEQTANKLETLIAKAKLTVQLAVLLLRKWLRGLPGVGQFFIEQVVKIKADRLLELMNQAKHVLG